MCFVIQDINASFIGNTAFLDGGAIYADQSSSTPDISSALQFATNVGRTKHCFLNTTNISTFNYRGKSVDGKVPHERQKNNKHMKKYAKGRRRRR